MYSSFKKHQLITESWRRFLFEEISGVEKHNIDFYTNEILTYPRMPKDLLDILKGINPSQVILKLQPLANNKIVKILGAGSFGITLELDNGHVLKLYNSRYSPKDGEPPPEDQFYKKSMDALYSGEGSRTALPVFAQGTINLTDNNLNKRQLKFVEMGKLNAGVRWDNTNMDRIKQVISPYLIELRSRLQSYTDNFDKSTVKFQNTGLDATLANAVFNSMAVINPLASNGGGPGDTADDIRLKAMSTFTTQPLS